MSTHIGKAISLTETNREIFAFAIPEPIPAEAKYLLLTKDGYLFFEEAPAHDHLGTLRVPHVAMFTYYNIEIED